MNHKTLYKSTILKKNKLHLFFMLLFLVTAFSCNKKDNYSMQVFSIIGNASLVSANNTLKLKENDTVNIGDTIITEDKSSVTLYVGNQSAVRIHENSKFIVSSRTVDTLGNLNNSDFDLQDGKIFVVIKRLSVKGSYSVSTPTSVVAVRGTEFTVDSYRDKDLPLTRLDVIDGSVEIRSRTKEEVSDSLGGGETVTLTSDRKIKEKTKIETPAMGKLKEELIIIHKNINDLESKKSITSVESSVKPDNGTENITKPTEKTESNSAVKKPPVLTSETQIRKYYSKLEKITLDDGSVILGAVISQGKTNLKIHTVNGVISVPKGSVVNVVMQ